jgi:hypothetical protein
MNDSTSAPRRAGYRKDSTTTAPIVDSIIDATIDINVVTHLCEHNLDVDSNHSIRLMDDEEEHPDESLLTVASDYFARPIVVGYAFGPKKMSTMGVVMAEASKAKLTTVPEIGLNELPMECGGPDCSTTLTRERLCQHHEEEDTALHALNYTPSKIMAICGISCSMCEPCAHRPWPLPPRRHPLMVSNRPARTLLEAVAGAAAVVTTTVATRCRPCVQRLHPRPIPRRTPNDGGGANDAAVLAQLELTVQRVACFLKLWSDRVIMDGNVRTLPRPKWRLRQLYPFECRLCLWILVRRSKHRIHCAVCFHNYFFATNAFVPFTQTCH